MLPVEIYPIQDAMVLRARGSELLILADHVAALKNLKSAGEFARYFMDEALVNRPARKLFEAWLRKDGSLWARIYKTVQTIESTPGSDKPEVKSAPVAKPAAKTADAPKEKVEAKAPKKDEKETKKAAPKKAEPKKTETKAAAKPAKADEKKAAPKSAAKPAAKTAAKPAAKSAAKAPAKKTSKK